VSSDDRGPSEDILLAHFAEHLVSIPDGHFPSRGVHVNQRGSHKRVRLKAAFGDHTVNLFPFSNRVRLSTRLHNHWKSEAVRRSTGTVHLREQNDDVEGRLQQGKASEHGVPSGAVWLRRSVEHPSGVTHSSEARTRRDETGGDVIVALESMGDNLGMDLVQPRARLA